MAGTLVANTINTDTGLFSTNNAYLGIAKAWVKFNSSGTRLSSFNVSSVTVNSTGYYTITFTTAMADANYSAIATTTASSGSNGNICATVFTDNTSADIAPTTTTYTVNTGVFGVGNYATRSVCTAVFGN
jgi:hypothetical protein